MSYCRYWVQLPTEKTSGKNSLQNKNYAEVYTIQPCRKKKKTKTEVEQTDVKGDSSGEAELKQNVDILCWGKFFSFCFSFSHLPVIVNSFCSLLFC